MSARTEPENCLAAALRMLSRRDHSCSEISTKLFDRGFSRDQIKWAVNECLRLHYLDDARYADMVAGKLQRKGYGCHRLHAALMSKGLDDDTIASCLENYCRENVQIRTCRQALEKKKKGTSLSNRSLGPAENKAKLYRFLVGRGFAPAVVRQVMQEAL